MLILLRAVGSFDSSAAADSRKDELRDREPSRFGRR
jgi:hypothetical protein